MEMGISVPPTFIDSHGPTQLQGRLVPRRGRARIQSRHHKTSTSLEQELKLRRVDVPYTSQ